MVAPIDGSWSVSGPVSGQAPGRAESPPPAAAANATAQAALEHRARGLLNLIVLAQRCLADGPDAAGGCDWRVEVERASGELASLRAWALQLGADEVAACAVRLAATAAAAAAA